MLAARKNHNSVACQVNRREELGRKTGWRRRKTLGRSHEGKCNYYARRVTLPTDYGPRYLLNMTHKFCFFRVDDDRSGGQRAGKCGRGKPFWVTTRLGPEKETLAPRTFVSF
jgi:hypothetical protein